MSLIRKELTFYGRKLVEKGLVTGPGGNISVREGSHVYLSPSGFFLDEISEKEWVKVNLKTGKTYGKLRPTCEISMHLGIYEARKDVKAVIHSHPPLTVGIVSAGGKLKPLSPDYVALLGRNVPVLEYVPPAGREIREKVTAALKKHNAVLLKNHGAVCAGETLKEAYARSLVIEETAKSFVAGQVAGTLRHLTQKEAEQIENMEAEDYRKNLLKK